MEKKISVIVPIYNTGEFIYDCVQSVLNQTYKYFELILIDDGSQDNSKYICEKMCASDSRIRFIQQDHKGVSAARNAGIEAAEGKYIFFLDSDDFIHPQILEFLYKLQEKNHTVIATAGFYYEKKRKFNKIPNWRVEEDYREKSCCLENSILRKSFIFLHDRIRLDAIGGKMVLSKAAKSIRFDENLTHGEDTLFLYQLISNGANASVLLRKWYFYRRNGRSNGKDYTVASCRSRYEVQSKLRDYEIKNNKIGKAVYTEWIILCEMVMWYEMGKKYQDDKLEKYVENLIKAEKESWIFSRVDWKRKVIFYIGCGYYPLYKLIADFLRWYHRTLDIPRELRDKKR